MKRWLRRIRGVVGMGLTWAVGWGLAGLLIGVSSILLPGLPWWEVFFEFFDDELLQQLVLTGFVSGTVFSTVLGIAGRHRRFDELSLRRFGAWGAAAGLLLGLLPAAMVTVGLASLNVQLDLWLFTALLALPLVLLGAVSASGSLMLARMGEDPELLDATADVAEVGLTGDEVCELLGGRD